MNSFSHFRSITVNRDLRCKTRARPSGQEGVNLNWPNRRGYANTTNNNGPVADRTNYSGAVYPKPKNLNVGCQTLNMNIEVYTCTVTSRDKHVIGTLRWCESNESYDMGFLQLFRRVWIQHHHFSRTEHQISAVLHDQWSRKGMARRCHSFCDGYNTWWVLD